MLYPKPNDNYSCDVFCKNFMEIDGRLLDLENASGASGNTAHANSSYLSLPVLAESENGATYTVKIDGLTEIVDGLSLTIIPNMTSTTKNLCRLQVEGLEDGFGVIQYIDSNGEPVYPDYDDFLLEGHPIRLVRYGFWWIVDGRVYPSASSLVGTLPVSKGGTGYTTVDDVPTENSPRMVKSGGIHNYVASVYDSLFNIDYKYNYRFDGNTAGKVTASVDSNGDDTGLLFVKVADGPTDISEWWKYKVVFKDGGLWDEITDGEPTEDGDCYCVGFAVVIAPIDNAVGLFDIVFPKSGVYVLHDPSDASLSPTSVHIGETRKVKAEYLPEGSGSTNAENGNEVNY
jgi:hypothetical protein